MKKNYRKLKLFLTACLGWHLKKNNKCKTLWGTYNVYLINYIFWDYFLLLVLDIIYNYACLDPDMIKREN